MKILAIEKAVPGVTSKQFSFGVKQAEAARVWELYQIGVIREMYFRAYRSEAVLVLECQDVSEARAHLHTLPFVSAHLIDFEVIPLVAYPGFARLFAAGLDKEPD